MKEIRRFVANAPTVLLTKPEVKRVWVYGGAVEEQRKVSLHSERHKAHTCWYTITSDNVITLVTVTFWPDFSPDSVGLCKF